MWASEEYFQSVKTQNHEHINLNVEDPEQRIVEFARGADVLIHDAQYTPAEFQKKNDWGHSTYQYAVEVAMQAGVDTLILFHHEPEHPDAMIANIEREAQSLLESKGANIKCKAAYEGLELTF